MYLQQYIQYYIELKVADQNSVHGSTVEILFTNDAAVGRVDVENAQLGVPTAALVSPSWRRRRLFKSPFPPKIRTRWRTLIEGLWVR
jgi:hypothetical protein